MDKNLCDISSENKAKNILLWDIREKISTKLTYFSQTWVIYNVDDKQVALHLMSPSSHSSIYLQMCECVCLCAGINIIQTSNSHDPKWVNTHSSSVIMRHTMDVHTSWSMPFKNGAGQLKLVIQWSHIRILNDS